MKAWDLVIEQREDGGYRGAGGIQGHGLGVLQGTGRFAVLL